MQGHGHPSHFADFTQLLKYLEAITQEMLKVMLSLTGPAQSSI